jgi:DNA-binding LytR/AlgR family response regulator
MNEKMNEKVLLIAVYDSEAADCARTARTLRRFFNDRGVSAEVKNFTNDTEFVYDCKNKSDAGVLYDLAFIGVDNMLGAETARHVRQFDKTMPQFFVSQVSEYALEAFRVTALDFLTKPVSPRSLEEAFSRLEQKRRADYRIPDLLIDALK